MKNVFIVLFLFIVANGECSQTNNDLKVNSIDRKAMRSAVVMRCTPNAERLVRRPARRSATTHWCATKCVFPAVSAPKVLSEMSGGITSASSKAIVRTEITCEQRINFINTTQKFFALKFLNDWLQYLKNKIFIINTLHWSRETPFHLWTGLADDPFCQTARKKDQPFNITGALLNFSKSRVIQLNLV